MRITKYLNETVAHEAQTGTFDGEGQPVYATAETIACRKEISGKVIKDTDGREHKATSRYFTDTAITEGDLLDSKKVISAQEYKGRTGAVQGYEVYV
jgi:hypothetical protein